MLSHMLRAVQKETSLVFVGGYAVTEASAVTGLTVSLTSLTGGIASAPQAGDIVVVAYGFSDATNRDITCSTSGYTELTDLYANDTVDAQMAVFYKVLSSAETSVTFDNGGASVRTRAALHVWRNQNATPIDTTTQTNTGVNAGTPNCPQITTTTPNAIVLAFGYGSADLVDSPLTVPSGMSNFFEAGGLSGCIAVASYLQTTAGDYNPAQFGGGHTASTNSWVAATVAIRD